MRLDWRSAASHKAALFLFVGSADFRRDGMRMRGWHATEKRPPIATDSAAPIDHFDLI
jgi:hypothetical protein